MTTKPDDFQGGGDEGPEGETEDGDVQAAVLYGSPSRIDSIAGLLSVRTTGAEETESSRQRTTALAELQLTRLTAPA